ncbi:hypothetical protein HN51_055195 [Arachis hypogaea]|uniref:CBS domain-containing protein n=1 Tax=Arachis hypogaea TaxID=3818 RepID=A0A444XNV1_ARAHY|nr:CBS domain-containing protein CBSX6-like [Arachis ipaensis]XP_025677471.1 CBS domain-containing protein CBSX6-like [Arachis hypogaea]QHN77856.1 CBS domain-containing protein [Arachis hypogaea]RYQ91361.1 hypothetical protein Ahy_B09g097247 isoform B [Arachis hypogaea]
MALAFVYHTVGDLTVGKPDLVEFHDTETLKSAIQAIADSPGGSIPIWKKRSLSPSSSSSDVNAHEDNELRQQRFVGMLSSLDIAAFLANTATSSQDQSLDMDRKLNSPVSEVVVPNNSLLKIVDPSTRLIDALELMKQGVKRLLVHKCLVWKGSCKHFSVVYYSRWLKNIESSNSKQTSMNFQASSTSSPSRVTSIPNKFCCLSREDVLRFIIGYLGALAPLPLTSMAHLGAINSHYNTVESFKPAIEAAKATPTDSIAVAVVEQTPEGKNKIIGEISAHKLWKCDYIAASWALANLSAGQFVMGVEDNDNNSDIETELSVDTKRPKRFSSRSIRFLSNPSGPGIFGQSRSMYRGRSAPLTCKVKSTLAAVMAQMLSHRATHVWVTEDERDDVLVGIVGYADILDAVTKPPTAFIRATKSTEIM